MKVMLGLEQTSGEEAFHLLGSLMRPLAEYTYSYLNKNGQSRLIRFTWPISELELRKFSRASELWSTAFEICDKHHTLIPS